MENTESDLQKELLYYKKLADDLGGTNISYDARISAVTTEVRKFKEGLAVLNQLQRSIDVKASTQEVFESTMNAINTKLRLDRSIIFLEDQKDLFVPAYTLGFEEGKDETLKEIKLNLPDQLLQRDDYWLINKASPITDETRKICEQIDIPFLIAVPIFTHQQRVGILVSGRMKEIRPFFPPLSHVDVELFQTIGAFLSVSATNSGAYNVLERLVSERTQELTIEKKKSDDLLLNVLPAEVAEELKIKGFAEAKYFDEVSVLFTDFVNFTIISELLSPQELVDELHYCFKAFDEIVVKYNIEKIKTIGDAYLAVAGLPNADANHAASTVKAALEIRRFTKLRREQKGDKTFDIRIGIHSGNVVAGIVGVIKFAYDIWGDTVNTAARIEQNSLPGHVNLSEKTYELVKDLTNFNFTYRGEIQAKNKGALKMYFVEEATSSIQD